MTKIFGRHVYIDRIDGQHAATGAGANVQHGPANAATPNQHPLDAGRPWIRRFSVEIRKQKRIVTNATVTNATVTNATVTSATVTSATATPLTLPKLTATPDTDKYFADFDLSKFGIDGSTVTAGSTSNTAGSPSKFTHSKKYSKEIEDELEKIRKAKASPIEGSVDYSVNARPSSFVDDHALASVGLTSDKQIEESHSEITREDFVALKRTVGDRMLTLSDFARQRMVTLAAEKNLRNVVEEILDDRTRWQDANHEYTVDNEITFKCTVTNDDGANIDCRVYMSHDVETGKINGLEIFERWNNTRLGKVTDSGDNSLLIRTNPSWEISPRALQYLPDSTFRSSKEDRDAFRNGLTAGTFLRKSGGIKVVSGNEAKTWYKEALNTIRQAHNVEGIDEEDLVAINMYTRYSDGLKSACKTGNIKELEELQPFIRCLASGLNRLGPEHTYDGPLYRGAEWRRNLIDAYRGMVSKTIIEPAVVSTSTIQNFQWPDSNVLEIITPKKRPDSGKETEKAQGVSSSNKGKETVAFIDPDTDAAAEGSKGKNIVELSNSPQEKEVTFPFLGEFKILKVEDGNPNFSSNTGYSSLQFPLVTIYKEEV